MATLTSHRIYWITWFVLLCVTLFSVGTDHLKFPILRIVLLLILMLSKATLIAMNFMHLSYEKFNLVLTVVVGILLTSLILFTLISVDAYTAHKINY